MIVKVKKLSRLASDPGVTLPDLAIAWSLKNPVVSTVITGASRPQQVVENMKSLDAVKSPIPDATAWIEKILENEPAPSGDYRNE